MTRALGILLLLVLAPDVWGAAPAGPDDDRHLGRAVDLWLQGDLHGAVARLELIDVSRTSSAAEADRAAFLLAVGHRRLDDASGLARVAALAGDPHGSDWRRWVAYLGLLETAGETGVVDGFAGSSLLAAARLLVDGQPDRALDVLAGAKDPAGLQLRVLAAEVAGRDPREDRERLAGADFRTPGEADLVGAAILALAGDDLAAGRDPGRRLEQVPPASRHAARARHLLALRALERGDTAAAVAALDRVAAAHPAYPERRAVLLELGALAGAGGDWAAALARYETAEAELAAERQHLAGLREPAGAAAAWSAWQAQSLWRDEIRLDTGAARTALDEAVVRALDLTDGKAPPRPERLAAAASGAAARELVDRPTAREWDRVRASHARWTEAAVDVAAQAWLLQTKAEERDRRALYLERGRGHAVSSADTLAAAVARLDLLLARLDRTLADLDQARDRALARFGSRCRTMATELRRNLLYLDAVRHFHVAAPGRGEALPPRVPSPAELLSAESDLALAMETFLELFATQGTALVNRSHDQVWRPRLAAGSPALRDSAAAQLDRARLTVAALDRQRARLAEDPAWHEAVARQAVLVARRDSLARAHDVLRLDIAVAVAERGQARLRDAEAAVALHAAEAAYWLAVAADEQQTEPALARNSRAGALERHRTYLANHPQDEARSELRFRLADLHLMQARDDFRGRMGDFLGQNPTADDLQDRGLAPFLDTAPALELYAAILTDDPGYAHREAVLFSLGMILADDGRPAGADHLRELVTVHPGSPYAQESWLRLGDVGFDRRDLVVCREAYAQAAAGDDPDLTAIALYKLGWARFEDDMFTDAADAFAALLDHGVPDGSARAPQDLTAEAEEYLVRALVRAGGAPAFVDHVARHGERPYAADILFAMARLDRRFSLYAAAAACDELWLTRYGNDPRALAVAERLVDTHRLADRPDEALAALLATAPRFLEGSTWQQTNGDPELRARGRGFAQEAYRTAATRAHRTARATDDPQAWQAALGHYETWLGHWADDPGAPRLHYQAGEAALNLERHEAAIDHFSRAAAADTGAFLLDAAWQTVAVTDAWYETSGADSLAARLLAEGESFLTAHPADPRAADLRWRAANLAHAHQWHQQAAGAFAAFAAVHRDDPRAPDAARLAGDAWYRRPDLVRAADAYEHALGLARAAGRDSLADALAAAVPLVRFQHAEAVAADSSAGPAAAAPLFLAVADRWPGFAHADLALYRAGLGLAAADGPGAVAAWERLLADHPDSEYDRDAALEIARLHGQAGRRDEAVAAYTRFSRRHADDPDAAESLLTAMDLAGGDPAAVRPLQEDFLARFPGETEHVMEIRHGWALAALGAGGGAASPDLAGYLAAAADHPELADPRLLAEVDYRRAERAFAAYEGLALTQPLAASLELKKARLEEVVTLYNRCVKHGVREYAHASAHRIGAAIVHFGDALTASERPADLSGDDLLAYDEVLAEQGWAFYARGEAAWNELLKRNLGSDDDPGAWIARTREELWPRVALRFMHQPEVEYPLVAAVAPEPEGGSRVSPAAPAR